MVDDGAHCPVCAGDQLVTRFAMTSSETENGVSPDSFRPSADRYGAALGTVVRCATCGHGFVSPLPSPEAVASAYAKGADPVSLRETEGQVETARRALERIEQYRGGLGRLVDLGCWTGSFLLAARQRGWVVEGVEPSDWASDQARQRGLTGHTATIEDHVIEAASCDVVVLCDVLEHAADPAGLLSDLHQMLRGGGTLFLTVPDAGSRLARVMGRRWWSILPMHLQYFTRGSLTRLLESQGFEVNVMWTHAKVFTATYYAERLAGYSSALAGVTAGTLRRLRLAERLVAPDFRDRVAVIATKIEI